MKTFKRLLTLSLIAALAVQVWGADESVTFSSVYSADDKPTVYNGTNFSITFDKGTNSNAPIYKTTGAAVRIYGGGYFEVSSTTKNINKIELTFGSGDGSNAITTNGGSFTSNTWTGSATSVRFTIGGTTGHRRLASVAVTYASGGGSTYTVTLSKNGSTSDITGCTGTYPLPTSGEHVANACDGWAWHCWTNAAYSTGSPTSTAPSSTVITTMSSAGTAYAVYKHTETSGASTPITRTMNSFDAISGYVDGDANISYAAAQGGASTAPVVNSHIIRIYQNGGTLTLTANNGKKISRVTIGSSMETTVRYQVDGGAPSSNRDISANGTVTTPEIDGGANSVTFTCMGTTSSTRLYLNYLSVTYSDDGGSTTYYSTDADCAECMNKVTLTKGTPEHGSFLLDKADGAHNNCAAGGLVVTVSGITPADGYQFKEITQTGIASGVTINQTSKTVTYAKDVTGASTINVVFEAIPTYTVTLNKNGSTSDITGCSGTYTLPTTGAHVAEACEGWSWHCWANAPYSTGTPTATAPSSTVITSMSSAGTAYAVYKHEETSGGSSTVSFAKADFSGSETISASKDGVTVSCVGNIPSASYVTFTEGNTLTISSSSGNITAIDFTCSGDDYTGNMTDVSGISTSSWSITVNNPGSKTTVRVSSIVVTIGGGSTTTYTSSPDCTPCDYKVTLTKGEQSHGTFTLDKSNGVYNNCTSNFVVTVSGISPVSGYYCTGVTATGDHNEVSGPDGSGNYTVTYTKGYSITSEVTANFAPNPKYTVTWYMNGDETHQDSYEEGEAIVFPGSADGCDGKVFRGWSADPVAETDIEPSYVTSATMPAHAVTYYAVYAEASTGSGTPTTETYGFEDADDDTNWTIDAAITKSSSAKATGTYGGIINTDETYITFNNKVKVTNFSFKLARTSKNSNYYVNIETSTDGSVWTEAESYEMSSFSNGSFTPKSKDFDGNTELYVRLFCYNTTAVRYIDDISITYGGGTTYSGYTTTCGAGISAKNIGWITAAAGKKVKRVITVSAKNFDDPTTLNATCTNSNFDVTLEATSVPAGATGLTTTLTVEYTPSAPSMKEENVEIVLTAGDKTRTITVNGRSVPDDFLLITKKSSTWYALPANMNSGSNEYDGVVVSPNDATTPTSVAVSPSTVIYNLASVANSRYADNGHLVRLVGNGTKCLWGNKATGATKVNIQNYAALSESNGDNYEWDLKTTDGVHYFVESPCNAEYAEGRRLAYGTKFGMYKEESVFYIVSAGCTSQPGDVVVNPRRVEATFSWVSNASSMAIDLYTNEFMTEGHKAATASSSPYIFTGLEESKPYWYRLTPDGNIDCAVTGSFITSGPLIDIVEWQENGVVLFIDKGDINPKIVIDGQEEHGSITGGGTATELFFAKYFEGAGSMKLLSIFNGTKEDISLAKYKFYDRHAGDAASSYDATDKEYALSSLGSIKAGQEIIFFSRPLGTEPVSGCSTDFLNAVATKNTPEDNPRWIECASGKFANKAINFNGNDALLLKKDETIIDVIGALNTPGQGKNCTGEDAWEGTIKNMDKGKSPSDPVFDAFYEASSKSPVSRADSIALLAGFGINLTDDEINIPTARCIFFRDKRVTCGDSAVALNTDDFVTFTNHTEGGQNYKAEWYGRSVCMTNAMKTAAGVANDAQATCNSYQDIANMDYNKYYIDWKNIEEGKELSSFTSDAETKEYTIPIDDMRQYACLKLRFQLVHEGNVLTEASQQVPIVVVGDNVDTNDPLFSELVIDKVDESDPSTWVPLYPQSVERCKDCDVVILGSAKLTKGSNSDEKDVPEVGNIKVYPGGKLVIPTGTEYTVKSLALRRQEDVVASANIQGTLTFKTAASPAPARQQADGKSAKMTETPANTYFDLRIDPTNWHFITLPYDVKVSDIRFANPEETAIPVLGSDYLLQWYNGERRARTKHDDAWEPVNADATLKKGLGYIFALPGGGKVKREFRFPMSNDVITEEATDKFVESVYGYGCDQPTLGSNHKGWNLIGSPYLMPYTSDIESPLRTGLLIEDHSPEHDVPTWDGSWTDNGDGLYYIAIPINNGWDYYYQDAMANYPLEPFTSYFVQIGGSDPAAPQGVDFKASQVPRSIVRRAPQEYEDVEDTHPVWCEINLTNPQGETDKTTFLVSNQFTDDYDIMKDFVKMRGGYYSYYTRPVLASRNNEGEMAFNALPDASAIAGIPLNYFAAAKGNYTIAYNDKYDKDQEVKEVKLWDKTTEQWYDLMTEPYTFTSNRVDNKDRFILSIRVDRKTPQIATDYQKVGFADTPRKILIDGHVYIQRGKAIYDITGKQVENR